MWSWQGGGSNAPNAADCRLLFRSDNTLSLQFESAGTNSWQYVEIGSWVQNTWYKVRAVYNTIVFQAYLDDVLVLAAQPSNWFSQPKYIGLRGGDPSSTTSMQARNFNVWIPVLP